MENERKMNFFTRMINDETGWRQQVYHSPQVYHRLHRKRGCLLV